MVGAFLTACELFEENTGSMATAGSVTSIAVPLRLLIILLLSGWVCVWILMPTELWKKWWHGAEEKARKTIFGYYGLHFAILSLPILVVAILGFIHLHLHSCQQRRLRMISVPKFSVPIVTNGPLGVISAAEILSASLFILFLVWTYYSRLSSDLEKVIPIKSLHLNKMHFRVMKVGTRLGSLAEACLVLLLLPILRRLSLFQLLGLQFETSVRYHIWLGNVMLLFAAFHGFFTLLVWGLKHKLADEIFQWQQTGRVNIAGVITLVIGLIIWITSLPQIRSRSFAFFYNSHHLYILFLVFFLFHAGDRHFYTVLAGVLLYALDKFIRVIQSTQVTAIISARLLPCRAVELTFPKPSSLRYTPSSIIFMKISTISRFQWHPFSISSCSTVDEDQISVIAKCQGWWTNRLYNIVEAGLNTDVAGKTCIPIAVEGPYGPPSIFYQRYESLLLIAGGIGITPFLSIVQEVAARNQNTQNKLGTRVQLIYVVKKCQDLSMLSSVLPLFLGGSNVKNQLKLHVYVTQEDNIETTAIELLQSLSPGKTIFFDTNCSGFTMPRPESYQSMAMITLLSVTVLVISSGILHHAFLGSEKEQTKKKIPSWVNDLLLVLSFIIAVGCGSIVGLFLRWRKRKNEMSDVSSRKNRESIEFQFREGHEFETKEPEIYFKQRPNFTDVYSRFERETGATQIGVLVCGPETMQQSVAATCRQFSFLSHKKNAKAGKASFSFHSLSFAL